MLKATIVGNLGTDPEMRYSADGQPILRFSVKIAKDGRTYGPLADRMLAHSVRSESHGDPAQPLPCLLTTYSASADGYGQTRVANNKSVRIHVEAYRLWVGPIPNGYQVNHPCLPLRLVWNDAP